MAEVTRRSRRISWRWVMAWAVFCLGSNGRAADWPQYRGLNHDGSSSETLRTNWTQNPPKIVWKRNFEPGWSSITVSGGRAFTQVNRRVQGVPREVCVALNADTGVELWARPLDQADYPDAGTGPTDGPRSTPSVDGDRVYVFTSYLRLFCLRAETGAVVWSRDFIAEFPGTEVIDWQNAASPLVVGDLIFLNSNVANQRLMAVNKLDGTTVWARENDTMTHATPVYATLGGTPQVVFLTLRGLVGVTPETGDVLWRYTFSPSSTSTAASPVVADNWVYASCAYGKGAWTTQISRNGNTFSAAPRNYSVGSAFQNHWATPVHHEGHLYGLVENSGGSDVFLGSLACFDPVGRANRWMTNRVGSRKPGRGGLIKVGNHLVALTEGGDDSGEGGELVLVTPNPSAYTEISRYRALDGKSWNHPTFANGRIYARSSKQIVALDVAAALPPLPELSLSATLTALGNQLRLEVVAIGGAPLDAAAADRIELLAAPDLASAPPPWSVLSAVFAPSGGKLVANVPLDPNTVQFLRVRERATLP